MLLGLALAGLLWPVPPAARVLNGFQRYDSSQGLSHNSVYALAQDNLGYIWIGTADGLNRFDGYRFKIYRQDPERRDTLSSSLIRALLVDPAGTLWVGTEAGLNRYRPAHDDFEQLPAGSERIRTLFYWRDQLCAGHTRGLGCLRAGHWTPISLEPPEGQGTPSVWSAVVAVDGSAWLMVRAAASGQRWIVQLDGETQHWQRLPDAGGIGTVIGIDGDGRTWWHAGGPSTTSMQAADAADDQLWAFEQNDHGLWLGTNDGLVQQIGDERRRYRPGEGPNAFLRNFVRSLLTDSAGELWVGTHGGLFRSRPDFRPFRAVGYRPDVEGGLGAPAVAAIHAGAGGRLWVGTYGGGLSAIAPDGSVQTWPNLGSREPDASQAVVWDIADADDGGLLLATPRGLFAFDPATGSGRRLPVRDPFGEWISMRRVEPGLNGDYWLATTTGLAQLDNDHHRWRWPTAPQSVMGIESLLVEPDAVWIGTRENELVRFEPATGAERRHRLPTALAGEGIWQIFRTRSGRLLAGTGSGLIEMDEARWQTRLVLRPPQLPGSFVYSIAEDSQGRLWLGTNRGLVRYHPDTAQVLVFGPEEGTGNIEFNRGAVAKLPDGRMVFGGMDGLTLFPAAAVGVNELDPPLVLTRLELHTAAGVDVVPPAAVDRLELSPQVSTVGFEFAALDYTEPASNRYRHRLAGFEQRWVAAGDRRYATYSALPPGDYRFEAMGTNSDGRWSSKVLSLPVTVLPPFWQTWWFRLLVASLLAAAASWLYRRRVAHLLAVERLRWRIADDLHDDLSSELSGIAVTADLLRRSSDSTVDDELLGAIARTAQRSVDALRDIVWTVNPDHDRGSALVERFRALGQRLFPDQEFSLVVDGPVSDLGLPMAIRRNLFLIYKEALHNVLRHASAANIQATLRHQGAQLELIVEDDGIGPGAGPDGTGLGSMRRRAHEIHGELSIEPRPGGGTRVALQVGVKLARTRDGKLPRIPARSPGESRN